ncbi:MAG: dynamin family protein [Lentisphaeria bacterium]|nr:dynamin family protein [Lentisphaeria bacterium]
MDTCTITIAGRFQQGKSTLVNCLLEGKFAETGNGLRTTACNTVYRYGPKKEKFFLTADGQKLSPPKNPKNYRPGDRMVVALPHPLLQNVTIIDSPGVGASEADDALAANAIQQSHAVLLLLEKGTLHATEQTILEQCRASGTKLIVLFNGKDTNKWHPEENKFICETIEAQLINSGFHDVILPIAGKKVFPCNLLWAWNAVTGKVDDKTKKLDYKLDTPAKCRDASGIQNIRHAIHNIPGILAMDFMSNMDSEIERISSKLEAEMDKIIQETAKKWNA